MDHKPETKEAESVSLTIIPLLQKVQVTLELLFKERKGKSEGDAKEETERGEKSRREKKRRK